MKSTFLIGLLFISIGILNSCNEQRNLQNKLVLQADYQQINDILSIADCNSSFGNYSTEVHSFKNGASYFRQDFGDDAPSFTVKLDSDNNGFIIDENKFVLDTLAIEDIEMIRGHELHKISIEPWYYFKDISFEKQIMNLGKSMALFIGKDKLGHPIELFYDPRKKTITKISMLNPKDSSQTIEILYITWIPTAYGDLAKDIKIVQAKKDTFHFNFTSLKIRDKTGLKVIY